jgi:hypothetical protein
MPTVVHVKSFFPMPVQIAEKLLQNKNINKKKGF